MPFRRKENLIARNDTVVNKIASYFEENKHKDASITKPVLLQSWSGNGKSTIAAEFAYRYGSQFVGTFWFDCNHSLSEQFEEIAHLLEIDIPASKTKQEKRHLCIDFTKNFINNRSCLLIFDNLLYFNTIEEFLPKSGKSRSLVLTTSSSQKHSDFFRKIPIEKISKEEALSLLLSGLDYDVEDVSEAENMVEFFDRLPFALELANSFLKDHNPVNITHFLNEIKERSIEWEGLVKTDNFNILHSSPSLLALIERNFERLKNYKEGYNELLNIVSVIGCLYLIKDKLDFHLIKEILGLQDDIPTDDIKFKKIAKYICDTGFSEENPDGFIIHSIYLEFFKLFQIKQPELFQTTQVKLKHAFQTINTQKRMGAWIANSLDKPIVELLDYSLSKHSTQEEHQIQTYFNLLASLFDVQSFYGLHEDCLATIAKASNLLEQAVKAPSFLKNDLEFLKGETLHKMKRYDDAYKIYKKLGSGRAAMRLRGVIYLHVYTGHIHRIRREWVKAEKNYSDAMLHCIEYREQQTDEQFLTNKLSIQLHQKCLFDQTDDKMKLQRVEQYIDETIDKLLEFSPFGREEFNKSNPHHYPFEIGQQLIQKCSTLPLSPALQVITFRELDEKHTS